MNYTKFVREYCKNNSGAFFYVSKLKDTEFSEVPYKTLLKILNRLEEEGLLNPVSKGVYFIGEKPVDEELIFDEYVDDGKGMFIGYQLFNDVGISNYVDCKIEIYTNNIKSKQKSVGQYFLKKVDLEFDDDTVDLVARTFVALHAKTSRLFLCLRFCRMQRKLKNGFLDKLAFWQQIHKYHLRLNRLLLFLIAVICFIFLTIRLNTTITFQE